MGTGSTVSQDRPAVDIALLVVRVVAGLIFAAHGAQKLFGAFGGPGLAALVQPILRASVGSTEGSNCPGTNRTAVSCAPPSPR